MPDTFGMRRVRNLMGVRAAVAAFTDDETGLISELHLPWDNVTPVSSPDLLRAMRPLREPACAIFFDIAV